MEDGASLIGEAAWRSHGLTNVRAIHGMLRIVLYIHVATCCLRSLLYNHKNQGSGTFTIREEKTGLHCQGSHQK